MDDGKAEVEVKKGRGQRSRVDHTTKLKPDDVKRSRPSRPIPDRVPKKREVRYPRGYRDQECQTDPTELSRVRQTYRHLYVDDTSEEELQWEDSESDNVSTPQISRALERHVSRRGKGTVVDVGKERMQERKASRKGSGKGLKAFLSEAFSG
jgi:hypothetical protein